MTTLTIRSMDDELWAELKVRAVSTGRSMEAEAPEILRQALAAPEATDRLGARIHQRFADVGFVDVDQPGRREPARTTVLPQSDGSVIPTEKF